MNQATVAIALQYAAQGIRANAIVAGFIDTPVLATSSIRSWMEKYITTRVPITSASTGELLAVHALEEQQYLHVVLSHTRRHTHLQQFSEVHASP